MVQMNSMPEDVLEQYKQLTALPISLNNARQLGGFPLRDGRHVKSGVLLRTTYLHDATYEDINILKEKYNLKIIFDMRGEDEIKHLPDPEIEGVRWIHVPVLDMQTMQDNIIARFQGHLEDIPKIDPTDQEQVMDFLILMALKDIEDSSHSGSTAYVEQLQGKTGQKSFGLFFREITALEEGAVLWHCYTGKDRTGIASGLLLDILGADWTTISIDYEISNLNFSQKIAETETMLRAKGIEEQYLAKLIGAVAGVHISLMEEAWKYLRETWGGAENYLVKACGVSNEELNIIRRKYIV